MNDWDLEVALGSPSKRRKKNQITREVAEEEQQESCAEEKDIEDLDTIQCGGVALARPPVVPSMLESEYPLTCAFAFTTGTRSRTRKGDETKKHDHEDSDDEDLEELRARLEGYGRRYHRHRTKMRRQQQQEKQQLQLQQQESVLSTRDERSGCLLEQLNPTYFAQDRYKWPSSMDLDMSEVTEFDAGNFEDFTTLFTTQKSASGDSLEGSLEHAGRDLNGSCGLLWPIKEDDDESCAITKTPDQDESTALQKQFGSTMTTKDSSETGLETIPVTSDETFDNAGFESHLCISRYGSTIPLEELEDVPNSTSGHLPDTSNSPAIDTDELTTTCHNCGVTKTPLWRRTPDKKYSLCNACGLYLKQYKAMRPLVPRLRSSQSSKKEEDEHIVCTNCAATKTSLWRKDEQGQVICNACGLYHKLHGKNRPAGMRKEKIARRKRYRTAADNYGSTPSASGQTPLYLAVPSPPPALVVVPAEMSRNEAMDETSTAGIATGTRMGVSPDERPTESLRSSITTTTTTTTSTTTTPSFPTLASPSPPAMSSLLPSLASIGSPVTFTESPVMA